LKVSSLKHVVDRIALDLVHGGKHTNLASMQHIKKSCQSVASSVISTTSTPRLSLDIQDRKSFSRPSKNKEVWDGKSVSIKSKSSSMSPSLDSRRQPLSMMNRFVREGTQKSTRPDPKNMRDHQSRTDRVLTAVLHDSSTQNGRVRVNDVWKHVKGFLSEGHLDSAYREALHGGNEQVLIELINVTGPVLDSLSNSTVNKLLSTLSLCVSKLVILEPVIPWLQQVTRFAISPIKYLCDCLLIC